MSILVPPPPALSSLRGGTRLVAGLGYATVIADMDFETYSESGWVWNPARQRWTGPPEAPSSKRGISAVGAAAYAGHPSTEVLCLAYDLKDGLGRRLWKPGDLPPLDLFRFIRDGGLIEAWKADFERHIWESVCVPRMGWPPIPRDQYRCAMAKARAHGLPGKLAKAGEVLNTLVRKDADGRRLLNLFSVPRNPTQRDARLRLLPAEHADGPLLYDYCGDDIATEAEVSSLVPDLDPTELANWQLDQDINARGVQIDTDSVNACMDVVRQVLARYDAELAEITGGAVDAASKVAALTAWLAQDGLTMASVDAEHVTEALARTDITPRQRRVLEIRELTGSASVKKLFAIYCQTSADGRLRDIFTYHGARTGRTTGSGPQPTNLPRSGPHMRRCAACDRTSGAHGLACPWCGGADLGDPKEWKPGMVDDALAVLAARSVDLAESMLGSTLPVIGGCLRGLFVAGPGKELICSDYSAIEAVVAAELAGEAWRKEVFRTHGKIYEMSAAKISGVPFADIMRHRDETGEHHPLRQGLGKVAELASAYQGWIGAWKAFGADAFLDDDQIKTAILRWRADSPAIVEMWGGQSRNRKPEMYGLEGAAVSACLHPGVEYAYRGIRYIKRGDVLYCLLLSGRPITYHAPRLTRSDRRSGEWSLSFAGWNTNPLNGPVGWVRMFTWGGRLIENVVQATARDIQWHGMRAQAAAGYPIVLHIYDENVAEVPAGWGSVEEFEALMTQPPPWAEGWPIRAAGGWRGQRYRK